MNIQRTFKTLFLEWISIVGPFVACFMFLNSQINKIDEKLMKQGERTDRLYELFVQQQKEFDQKFYDLLKEQKRNS